MKAYYWVGVIIILSLMMAALFPVAAEEGGELSLSDCLHMAFKQNISFISVGEDVHLQKIARALVKHNYGPLFKGTVSSGYSDGDTANAEFKENLEASVSQVLPTGGDAKISGSASGTQPRDGQFDEDYTSSFQLTLTQPLLRDSGYRVYREQFTQAEREVVYAVRALELARQDLAIDTVRRYYDIIGAKKVVEIYKRRLDDAILQRRRSEARFSVGKERGVDVSRARIQEKTAEQAYQDQVVSYERTLDDFKLFLNIPIDEKLTLVPEEISFVPVEIDLNKCISISRENRLDLFNARERLEDAERKLILARQDLRNRLDLTAGYTLDSDWGTNGLNNENDAGWNVGFTFTLPFDKWQERTSYESQIVQYNRARRQTKRTEDEVVLKVIETVRTLRRSENTIRIQQMAVEDAAQRLEQAKIDYNRGKGTNRDVVEAQNELASAQNQLVSAQIDYIIGKLELQREIGTLRIDEEGKWLR
ncbi:MAG: TolC family protein [Planctomycetes bacterium]|nr:TolC family protein [Planctomycetota bacterium]